MFDGGRSKPLDALRLTVLEAKPLTTFDNGCGICLGFGSIWILDFTVVIWTWDLSWIW